MYGQKYIVTCLTGNAEQEAEVFPFAYRADAVAYAQGIDPAREPKLYCVMPIPDREEPDAGYVIGNSSEVHLYPTYVKACLAHRTSSDLKWFGYIEDLETFLNSHPAKVIKYK